MKKPLLIISLAVLLGAWLFFGGGADTEISILAHELVPGVAEIERINGLPPAYRLIDPNGKTLGYFGVGEASGYGGPLQLAVIRCNARVLSFLLFKFAMVSTFGNRHRSATFIWEKHLLLLALPFWGNTRTDQQGWWCKFDPWHF